MCEHEHKFIVNRLNAYLKLKEDMHTERGLHLADLQLFVTQESDAWTVRCHCTALHHHNQVVLGSPSTVDWAQTRMRLVVCMCHQTETNAAAD